MKLKLVGQMWYRVDGRLLRYEGRTPDGSLRLYDRHTGRVTVYPKTVNVAPFC